MNEPRLFDVFPPAPEYPVAQTEFLFRYAGRAYWPREQPKGEYGPCYGCAFATHKKQSHGCKTQPGCNPSTRPDRKAIVWIRDEGVIE